MEPAPAESLILKVFIAVVAPIFESITVVPVPLWIVKLSSASPVASIVEEKSIFPPAPVPLLMRIVPVVPLKTKGPAILISSPSVTMSSLRVIVPVPATVSVTSPMSFLIAPSPATGVSKTIDPLVPAFKAISIFALLDSPTS